MNTELRLRLLFSKYLERRCTPKEVEELVGLLQQADAEKMLSGPMQAIWQQIREDKAEYAVNWDRMYEKVIGTDESLSAVRQGSDNNGLKVLQKIAAAFIGLLVISVSYWAISGNPGRSAQRPPMASGGNSLKQPPLNKRQTIHLPDGSTVILNADSKLSYPAAFAGNIREVYLTGEGYFDIVRHPGRPFLVHTGTITTLVLGTAFDIKAYPGDESIEVTVTHGKVRVLRENKSMGLLTANQQISFSKKTDEYAKKEVNAAAIIAWAPDEINFDDLTMQEVARQLELRFKVVIDFANPAIRDCRVTATFAGDDKLNEMLAVICGVSQSNYIIQNNKIIIDGKGCK